jgi:hypothetical protein
VEYTTIACYNGERKDSFMNGKKKAQESDRQLFLDQGITIKGDALARIGFPKAALLLSRHFADNWGCVDETRRRKNKSALKQGRYGQTILSIYNVMNAKVFVITQRKYGTRMFLGRDH